MLGVLVAAAGGLGVLAALAYWTARPGAHRWLDAGVRWLGGDDG